MKARLEQGEIKQYTFLPEAFLTVAEYLPTIEGHNLDEDNNSLAYVEGQIVKDADTLSDDTLKLFGFFDVEVSGDIDTRVEHYSDLYFDSEKQVYTKDIVENDFGLTLEEYKQMIINNYDHILHQQFSKTDYHYIKNLELGTEIPQDVLDERTALRAEAVSIKAEINALTKKRDVLTYNLPNYMI
jgi:hypothetical protein